MRIAHSFEEIAGAGPALLTIGTFDGVHRGHRFLLEQAAARAREHGYDLVVVTFDPCPAVVLRPNLGRYQLTTAPQKLRLLAQVGPALIVLLTFTRDLAALSADQFLDALEGRLRLQELWMGEDFHFGRDRAGGLAMLVQRGQRDGFAVHVVARGQEAKTSISSSRVREALQAGQVRDAMPLLGRPFALDLTAADLLDGAEAGTDSLRFTVAPHLALPASGPYAALLHGASGASEPAVADIDAEAAAGQVRLWPARRSDAPATVEFIDRLAGQQRADGDDLLGAARSVLAAWQRPLFPAAGDY